ncbi:cytochrome b/b6 domain-containing protein [Variovorax ureilyticus]|uniref:Cytochrome b/b6 domain-containing protein n=1 Tax=Variovorax ureilyticus TaxID=1836198 RepID=A0ABU8VMG1_9BURK
MPGTSDAPTQGRVVLVWDVAVRLLHWALAGLVVFCTLQDDGGETHRTLGYVAAGLVVARLLWAALTSGYGSLAALRPSLAETAAYIRSGAPRCIGHDPLGRWMIWLLWSLVLLLALTGWMSRLDRFWGDEFLQDLHAWIANGLLAAVALHLVGVAVMSRRWKESLSVAMLTGRKRRGHCSEE